MKKILLSILLFSSFLLQAQDKKVTANGLIVFEASVPFFEAVEAKNKEVRCNLNSANGALTFLVYIKDFHFERSLMEEHFNTNYMESKKYPKATFKGAIVNFDRDKITESPQEYLIKGKIFIHGKAQNIIIKAQLKKGNKDDIEINTKFALNSEDFNIEIPYLVSNKISKTVNVTVNCVVR